MLQWVPWLMGPFVPAPGEPHLPDPPSCVCPTHVLQTRQSSGVGGGSVGFLGMALLGEAFCPVPRIPGASVAQRGLDTGTLKRAEAKPHSHQV